MPLTLTNVIARDIRFPTSRQLDGSDAMNKDPDYSAAYVILQTDGGAADVGHGLTFTCGRGTDLCVAAVKSLFPLIQGMTLESITADMAGFWGRLTGDSQFRWLGPDKGVIHLATAAIVNAVWDLWARREKKPLWRLLADMTPEQLVACVDFKYITDAITPAEATAILRANHATKPARIEQLLREGFPAYTTSAGWLGYDDAKLRRLCQVGLEQGFTHFKLKVGLDVADDRRRCRIAQEAIGPANRIMVDANQWWDVGEAIEHMKQLAEFRPMWIEEPTSPDDVLGHAAIARALNPLGIGVATGEVCQNRILFKQFLQAGAMQYCQIDSCRLGGVNEVLAVCLMAKKFGVPVCPHAGGVGLCEYVQHLSMWDYISCAASLDGRIVEYVDHLHEHFVDPVTIRKGKYMPPTMPGYSAEIKAESQLAYSFPNGAAWQL